MNFTEQFLHFIWQFRLFKINDLSCVDGEKLQILSPGIHNRDAGPDFSQAKLRIAGTLWIGHAELHIRSSDWMAHGHFQDPAYNAVVLHVVYEHDQEIHREDGGLVPTLVLKDLFSDELFDRYQNLINNLNAFPCEKLIKNVDPIVIENVISRSVISRLEYKSSEVIDKLKHLKGNWEETFYFFMARSFGFKVNAIPFEMLALSLSSHILAKHRNNSLQIEALIFGQAGFLDARYSDHYLKAMSTEYIFLQRKYGLKPMDVSVWKFLRMRPQSFPTVRLAQFAAMMISSNHLFSKVLDLETLSEIVQLFSNLSVNGYWRNHYHFKKSTAAEVHLQIGTSSVHNIIINTICVCLFTYGKYTDQHIYIDRALAFLEELPSEHNVCVSQYVKSGLSCRTAFTSQALLELNKNYCSQKKCLNCGIGIKILNK